MKDWIQQKYPWTCSMVAALNAARWWNLPRVPSQNSPEWQRWIKRCGARYGAATRVERLHRHLGLAAVRLIPETWAIHDAVQQGIPVEATVWIPSAGLHAVLLVPGRDARRKSCAVALGMIHEHIRPKATASKRHKYTYVHAKISVEQLLADHCFPIGNPNRRFRALIPMPAAVKRARQERGTR